MSASTFLLAIIAGALPSLVWLWFWLREDAHPEPKGLIVATFLGGIIAVIVALFAEKYVASLGLNDSWRYSLWAIIEEVAKLIAVAAIVLFSRENDEPIDAMIYCIVGALGFAAVENILFLLTPFMYDGLVRGLATGNMRFIGATLVHIVSSATVGFALGLTFYRSRLVKTIALIFGLSLASALHAGFNLSIINGNTADTLKAFLWVWVAVVILIMLFEEIKAIKPKSTVN